MRRRRPPSPLPTRHRPRWLLRLRTRPLLFWGAALALAAAAAAMVLSVTADARATLERYGERRAVPVATARLERGDTISTGDVESRELPVGLIPDHAASRPVGRVVTEPVYPGEVIARERLAPDGLSGVAALLPPGSRALAVPVPASPLPVTVGDRVDLLASFDPTISDAEEPTFAVALDALVVDVGDGSVTVAVHRDEAPPTAFAVANGVVTVALTAPR